ncbi:MAG: hypothetical protein FD126_557, partial [Elusimicrobia bacterium]
MAPPVRPANVAETSTVRLDDVKVAK